jgi:hypothetical protein
VKGAFGLGTGDVFDSTALRDLTAGAYAFMPKRVHHFGVCKGETLLVEYGMLTCDAPLDARGRSRNPKEGDR